MSTGDGAAPPTDTPLASANGPAPPVQLDAAGPADPVADPAPERRVHGEVGVTVGTGGYRGAYLAVAGPLGDRGWGSVAVGATRSDRGGPWLSGPGDGPTFGPLTRDCVTVTREDGLGDPTLGFPPGSAGTCGPSGPGTGN
jgi:hypothetical protein